MLLSCYAAMHVMVTARNILLTDEAGVGNAAQAWCRVASAITKNDQHFGFHLDRNVEGRRQ
jgi:hypothetical protein